VYVTDAVDENAQNMTRSEYMVKLREYFNNHRDLIQPLLDKMSADDRFLDIDVVRMTLVRFFMDYGFTTPSERFRALFEVANESNYIRGSMSQEQYQTFLTFGQSIQCEEMKAIFMNRLERNSKFAVGNPAIDIAVIDLDEVGKHLSDYKGKVMYVDVWATWCAPCRKETPVFKTLSKKYTNISFIAISVDEKKATWESFLRCRDHYNVIALWSSEPGMQRNWAITGIPRFILIDEGFNIISANAPRPSETDKIIPLLEKLNKTL
jgi:thiol-disulfide isomerase/thioredoxin